MKKSSTLFLKFVIVLLGLVVLTSIVIFTTAVVDDGGGMFVPILIIMHITAVPFFFALFQAFKLLKYIDKGNAFSALSLKALERIKYSAIAVSAVYAGGMPFLFSVADKDDAPGVVGFGIIFIFSSIVIAVFAALLQKLVQKGLEMKSENELTV